MTPPITPTTTPSLGERLRLLESERAVAALEGLQDEVYLADLRQEIDQTRNAYVGAAVTEIATLRGALSGRPQG